MERTGDIDSRYGLPISSSSRGISRADEVHCLFHSRKHLRRRLRDERTGRPLCSPDDVNLLAALEGVLEFALDAAGEGGLAAGQFGDEADDHVGLVDHLEVAGVNLAHDVAADL